ncbi:hypothetical protein [Nostoc sp.]|uniref:hypothetical protein n=1 Tax=Nostoc sp. TaxID=1180 RepID=UPI002FF7E0DE
MSEFFFVMPQDAYWGQSCIVSYLGTSALSCREGAIANNHQGNIFRDRVQDVRVNSK